jgi:hypothetical protein
VQQLPILLFSPFVGVLVDRRRWMMVYADCGRPLLLAAVDLRGSSACRSCIWSVS